MGRYKHGMTGTRVHNTWLRMLDRCKNDRQRTYGKRGIQVCERWQSFEAFYADMGEPPTDDHSIDRIDNDGNYCPGNCRWATRTQQARNTSRNTILEHNGMAMTLAQWSQQTGIKASTICRRLYVSGWTVARALTEKPIQRLPKVKPWAQLGMSRSSWYRAGRPTA